MDLSLWHQKLKNHFVGLQRERAESKWPIFALEHGLTAGELEKLKESICNHIKNSEPLEKYWLPWVIYAAEIGYEYFDGKEYWQPFAEHTPGWTYNGNRNWIRDKFREFSNWYFGFQPSGIWAEQFSIICWPVTHAILPKYLHYELAKILYDLRDSFDPSILEFPNVLGKQIESKSLNSKTRFQEFAQNTSLVGQIATAILFQEKPSTKNRILPETLERVVKDLSKEKVAYEWLKDARNNIEVHGFTKKIATQRPPGNTKKESYEIIPKLEKRIILNPMNSSWEVQIELPDFSPLAKKYPELKDFLNNSRCRIAGFDGVIAHKRLLGRGTQNVIIDSWPKMQDSIIKFELPCSDSLKNILEKQCTLGTNSTWLCRIASDGRAYEVFSLKVRPKGKYILLKIDSPIKLGYGASSIPVLCKNMYAAQLEIPAEISEEYLSYIKSLQLQVARNISIWPVGLGASNWDGEGKAEWVVGEEPCIGIRLDHQVDSILLQLNDEQDSMLEVSPKLLGKPYFFQLPKLSVGFYKLSIIAKHSNRSYKELGHLDIIIREPQVWTPNFNKGAILINLDPEKPTLEQLCDSSFSIAASGPYQRSISISITLFGKNISQKLDYYHSGPLRIDAKILHKYISEKLQQSKFIDLAYSCQIDFNAEDLGKYSLFCEREFNPTRWVIQRSSERYTLSFIDDSGAIDEPLIKHYNFNEPDVAINIPYSDVSRGYSVPSQGGLYIAQTKQKLLGIIVPIYEWKEISKIKPKIKSRINSLEFLIELITLLELWLGIHQQSSICQWLQQKVIETLTKEFFALICGKQWVEAEQTFTERSKSPNSIYLLSRAISLEPRTHAFGGRIFKEYTTSTDYSPKMHSACLASVAKQFIPPLKPTESINGITARGIHWQAEFVLRLASAPQTVRSWSEEWFKEALNHMIDFPVLVRAARFIVLVVNNKQDNKSILTQLNNSLWEW